MRVGHFVEHLRNAIVRREMIDRPMSGLTLEVEHRLFSQSGMFLTTKLRSMCVDLSELLHVNLKIVFI